MNINAALRAIANDQRLRVKPQMEQHLLELPQYRSLSTASLLEQAQLRLGLARLGSIRGVRVTDRVTAIAILHGIKDNTAAGLVA
jgi:hypothetical protein